MWYSQRSPHGRNSTCARSSRLRANLSWWQEILIAGMLELLPHRDRRLAECDPKTTLATLSPARRLRTTPRCDDHRGKRSERRRAGGVAARTADRLRDDPLLACLMALARLLGRPMSASALTAGLPLPDVRPDAGAVPARGGARRAERTRMLRRRLDEIDPLTLPCVLLLEDRQACVLVRRGAGTLHRDPARSRPRDGRRCRARSWRARYAGHALFARPELVAVGRTAEPTVRARAGTGSGA